MISLEQKVKTANKDFYNTVGSFYEAIDGRRSPQLIHYLEDQFKIISKKTEGNSILDLGCGSGFVSKVAKEFFKQRYAIDISHKIIKDMQDSILYKIVADTDAIPIGDNKLNCIVTFAVLHHCYAYEKILSEIYRVLTCGGIFYSDHDMDSFFFKRFKPLLKLYRMINNSHNNYLSKFNHLTKEIYCYSEFHQNGIPIEIIESTLKRVGFKNINIEYHWFGLSPLTNKIFGKRSFKRGNAPLVKIFAVK